MKALALVGMMAVLLALPTVEASGVKGASNSMPNRLSMNVTTARQTQGQTFGEKVASGLQSGANAVAQGIEIGCTGESCMIAFPDGDGFRADLSALRLSPLDEAGKQALQHWGDPHESVAERGKAQQGASLLGGVIPGAGIVSAAVSSVGSMSKPGGAVSSSYAAGRMVEAAAALPSRSDAPGSVDVTQPLADGDYELAVVVEKTASGLKDTLKTDVRMAAPPPQVRIVLGFSVRNGVLKTRHETAKNSISNVR